MIKNPTVVTIKAEASLLAAIDALCCTPHMPSRAAFMRDALNHYLDYYTTVLQPAIISQKPVAEFYQEELSKNLTITEGGAGRFNRKDKFYST